MRFTILLTNGFRSSFQIPEVRHELSNFITQLSIKSGNLNQSCKFRAALRWKVAKFVEREVHAIRFVGLVIIIKMNPFTVQGKAITSSVREKVIESW